MTDKKFPDLKKLFDVPMSIFGFTKFYTDEFDAFGKYYDKIHSCNNGQTILHLVNSVDQLPFLESCELTKHVERFPRKDEQNEEAPELSQTNENIEFAHASLKIMKSPQKGRHLITTTKLDRGELIINESAAVLIVDPLCRCLQDENKMYRCHHCAYAVSKFYTCTTCNVVVYCSTNCLIKSYNQYHKFECEALQRHFWKLDETDYSYTAFRMMLYGARNQFDREIPNSTKWGNKVNNYPYIFGLQSHFHKLPVEKVYAILREALKTIIYLLVRTQFFKEHISDDQQTLIKFIGGVLVKHYCQAQTNSVLLRYPNFDVGYGFNVVGSTGKAICPTVALLNHACSPNAVIIPRNGRILVKTLKPIQPNTEITIAYREISSFFDLKDRQIIMQDYFYFGCLCQCTLCTYTKTWEEYPYQCARCDKGKAKKITLANGKEKLSCKDCMGRTDVDVKAERTALIAGNLYRASSSIDAILRVLESYNQMFPWDSWMLLDTYRILYNKYEEWGEKPIETMKYGLMYFSVLDQYLPRLYPPCLEARLRFFFGVVETDKFSSLKDVKTHEFDTIKYFMEDCQRIKKDILVYIPFRYLEFYILGLISKLEVVQFNLKIVA